MVAWAGIIRRSGEMASVLRGCVPVVGLSQPCPVALIASPALTSAAAGAPTIEIESLRISASGSGVMGSMFVGIGCFSSMGLLPSTMIGCSMSKVASVRSVTNQRPVLTGGR